MSSKRRSLKSHKVASSQGDDEIELLLDFVKVYENYFRQENAELRLEPEMLNAYVKRNSLTAEEAQFLLTRPHYIYASQAMSILAGTFNPRDYYRIANKNYYTKPLAEFLPAELLKLGILTKHRQFADIQEAKLSNNIHSVSVLDAHGAIQSGFVKLPDDLAICFTTQPFHVGYGSVESIIYQLQNTDISAKFAQNPMCVNKIRSTDKDAFKHMVVFYPGEMVPNVLFTPETNPKSSLFGRMGYYAAEDIDKHPVSYNSVTKEYKLIPHKTPFIGMSVSKKNNGKSAKAYKQFDIRRLIEGTSGLGKVSGVLIVDSCRSNPKLTSYERELVSRYETFINILNFVLSGCGKLATEDETPKKLTGNNDISGQYPVSQLYYDNIEKGHIPVFDYRLLPDYMFDKLTDSWIDPLIIKKTLIRRAFKIKALIGRNPYSYRTGEDVKLSDSPSKITMVDLLRSPELMRLHIMTLIDIGQLITTLKLLQILMNNTISDKSERTKLGIYWFADSTISKTDAKDRQKVLKNYYDNYLEPISVNAIHRQNKLIIDYMITKEPVILIRTKIIGKVHYYYTNNKDEITPEHIDIFTRLIHAILNYNNKNKLSTSQKVLKLISLIRAPVTNLVTLINGIRDLNTLLYGKYTENAIQYEYSIPVYYLILQTIIKTTNYDDGLEANKALFEKGFDRFLPNKVNFTDPKTGRRVTQELYSIPYLCSEYASNYDKDKSNDKLFKLVIGKLSFGENADQHDNALCRDIIVSAARTKCTPVIHVMFEHVYPKNSRNMNNLLVYIAVRHFDKIIWIIKNLPYSYTNDMLDNQDSNGDSVRDVLLDSKLSKLIGMLPHKGIARKSSANNHPEHNIADFYFNDYANNYESSYSANNEELNVSSLYPKVINRLHSKRSMRRLNKIKGTKKRTSGKN